MSEPNHFRHAKTLLRLIGCWIPLIFQRILLSLGPESLLLLSLYDVRMNSCVTSWTSSRKMHVSITIMVVVKNVQACEYFSLDKKVKPKIIKRP